MTDDELLKVLGRVADARREPPSAPTWERIQARRTGERRARGRRSAIGLLATAASLALLIGGIRAYRRVEHRRLDVAMTASSAIVIQRHLAQSDTMIGAFRNAVAHGTWNDDLTARAHDLDLATRRIQNGRIDGDSTLTGLLADLDLVLTEIAGYGQLTTHRDRESAMIEYSITVRQVVSRLRTASTDAVARVTGTEGLEP